MVKSLLLGFPPFSSQDSVTRETVTARKTTLPCTVVTSSFIRNRKQKETSQAELWS